MLMDLATGTESSQDRPGLDVLLLPPRNYDPTIGHFTSFDTFEGDTADPITLNHYLYAGANPVAHTDPGGHDFSLGEAMVGSTIGATLNSIQGEAGQFVLNSLYKKEADWNSIMTSAAFAFAGLGLKLVSDLGFKLLGSIASRGGAAIDNAAGVAQLNAKAKYSLKFKGNADSVLSSMENLYAKYLQDGGLPIILSSTPKAGKAVAGEISAVTKQITLYPGANWGTIAEELIHYTQLKRIGDWDKGRNPAPDVVKLLEDKIPDILARWGFVAS